MRLGVNLGYWGGGNDADSLKVADFSMNEDGRTYFVFFDASGTPHAVRRRAHDVEGMLPIRPELAAEIGDRLLDWADGTLHGEDEPTE